VVVRLAPTRNDEDYRLTFEAVGFGAGQQLTIFANNRELGVVALRDGWTGYTLRVPGRALDARGHVRLRFVAAREAQPPGGDQRLLAVAFRRLSITNFP
jgi:hypothetical protein